MYGRYRIFDYCMGATLLYGHCRIYTITNIHFHKLSHPQYDELINYEKEVTHIMHIITNWSSWNFVLRITEDLFRSLHRTFCHICKCLRNSSFFLNVSPLQCKCFYVCFRSFLWALLLVWESLVFAFKCYKYKCNFKNKCILFQFKFPKWIYDNSAD